MKLKNPSIKSHMFINNFNDFCLGNFISHKFDMSDKLFKYSL